MFTQCDVFQNVHIFFIQIEITSLLRIGIIYMLKKGQGQFPKNKKQKKIKKKTLKRTIKTTKKKTRKYKTYV